MKAIEVLASEYDLDSISAEELHKLINDLSSKNFTYSSQLSNYIKNNKLGRHYPNISGIVKMRKNEDTWDFEGGFPSKIYRIVCIELGLTNKQSGAVATDFISYENLNKDKSHYLSEKLELIPAPKRN